MPAPDRPISPDIANAMRDLLARFVEADDARLPIETMQTLGLFKRARKLLEITAFLSGSEAKAAEPAVLDRDAMAAEHQAQHDERRRRDSGDGT